MDESTPRLQRHPQKGRGMYEITIVSNNVSGLIAMQTESR